MNAQLDQANQETFTEPFLNGCSTNGFHGESLEMRLAFVVKGERSLHKIDDLYSDLSDGRVLLKLLEIFTGRKVSYSRATYIFT